MAQMTENKMATSINVHVLASDLIAREQMLASKSTLHNIATDSVNNPQYSHNLWTKISFDILCVGYQPTYNAYQMCLSKQNKCYEFTHQQNLYVQ